MKEDKYLWVVFSVVLFIIGIEYLLTRTRKDKVFRFQNTISNMLMGIFDRIAGLFMVPLIWYYYEFLYTHLAMFTIPETLPWFLFAVLITDFIWYFYHKSGHRINLFWGAHIIHHQSEDYNYSVALNLTPFQVIVRILFWSVMPILGFTPKVVLGTHLVIGLYQFLLHTTLIPKLGIIEKLFVTPSHHRVHHGSNPEYIDKNYGGVLIIWDKIFGTFEEEKSEVSYGITKDINSRDFLTSVFHYYKNLIYQMRQIVNVKEKFLLLVKGPDWVPASGEVDHLPLYIDKGSYNYQEYSSIAKFFILFNIALLLTIIPFAAYFILSLSAIEMVVIFAFVFLTLVLNGRLLENKKVTYLVLANIALVLFWAVYFYMYKM